MSHNWLEDLNITGLAVIYQKLETVIDLVNRFTLNLDNNRLTTERFYYRDNDDQFTAAITSTDAERILKLTVIDNDIIDFPSYLL